MEFQVRDLMVTLTKSPNEPGHHGEYAEMTCLNSRQCAWTLPMVDRPVPEQWELIELRAQLQRALE